MDPVLPCCLEIQSHLCLFPHLLGNCVHSNHFCRAAFSRFPASGPEFAITQVTNNYSSDIGRMIQGTISVPLYMNEDFIIPSVNCRLVLNATGMSALLFLLSSPFVTHQTQ